MVKYKLCAINKFGNEKIILEKTNLAEIDLFVYKNFKAQSELIEYYNNFYYGFYINYLYNQKIRNLDIIFNDGNDDFYDILKKACLGKIDLNLVSFENILKKVLRKEHLEYLLNNKYIDNKMYNDLFGFYSLEPHSLDYGKDYKDILNEIRYDINSYIKFRRMYGGIKNYQVFLDNLNKFGNVANTSDELVNNCFSYGGLDEVYSCYDLDDLSKIGKSYTLRIDSINKK